LKRIAVVMGTRPEIIKLAGLIRLLGKEKGIETMLVFTGQHYDYNLFNVFMLELRLPKAEINLGISGGSNEQQVAAMKQRLSQFFSEKEVGIVVAEGDTNSVLAAGLAAKEAGAEFAHVEAGLRSFDERMPEEKNRIEADKMADYAFAPTKGAVKNLESEAIADDRIFLTGNTIVEAVQNNLKKASKSGILKKLGLKKEKYAVLTAHRQEYVDRKECLLELLSAVEKIPLQVVFPMHPRTMKNLEKFGLLERAREINNLKIIGPIGYFDFLQLAGSSMFLLSDSGGIQEEASVYKKFVIVLRDSTERPEILGKFGSLIGYHAEKIALESKRIIHDYPKIKAGMRKEKCPFGDGKASERIVKILCRD